MFYEDKERIKNGFSMFYDLSWENGIYAPGYRKEIQVSESRIC